MGELITPPNNTKNYLLNKRVLSMMFVGEEH